MKEIFLAETLIDQLAGITTESGWRIDQLVHQKPHQTGGCFSVSYAAMADVSSLVGLVRYPSDRKLREIGRSMFVKHTGVETIAQSLLIKLKAYRHENEVRLVYVPSNETNERDGFYN